jgi:cyclic nucleotide gated channel
VVSCRFRSDLDSQDSFGSEAELLRGSQSSFRVDSSGSATRRRWEKGSLGNVFRIGHSLKFKGASSADMFREAEPKATGKQRILDPESQKLHRWNTFFVASCLVAVSVDPLFYYLPVIDSTNNCLQTSVGLKKAVTVFRTMTDFFYMIHMFLQFRTAYVMPSSRVFGRGDLVTDPKMIATRYLRKDFWLDLLAVLPVPQVRNTPLSENPPNLKTMLSDL